MGCAGSTPMGAPESGVKVLQLDEMYSDGCASWGERHFLLSGPMYFYSLIEKKPDATKKIRKPKPWKHPQPITMVQLTKMREEFWDTAPHYGGRKEIWDALRVAAESEVSLAQAIVESAAIIVSNTDLTLCYDERGAKYELPKYVLSEPINLIQDS